MSAALGKQLARSVGCNSSGHNLNRLVPIVEADIQSAHLTATRKPCSQRDRGAVWWLAAPRVKPHGFSVWICSVYCFNVWTKTFFLGVTVPQILDTHAETAGRGSQMSLTAFASQGHSRPVAVRGSGGWLCHRPPHQSHLQMLPSILRAGGLGLFVWAFEGPRDRVAT